MFKAGGYRSYPNYLSRAKLEHIRAKHAWTEELELEARESSRSVLRGLGPGVQREPLEVMDLWKLDDTDAPLVDSGPVGPRRFGLTGSLFILREIEASLIRLGSVRLDTSRGYAELTLPATKMDPEALGCTRRWDCVCRHGVSAPCAYHEVSAQLEHLSSRFGWTVAANPSEPLFPTARGDLVAKAGAVETIEALARLLGEPLVTAAGSRRFGGHTLRVSGSQFLAGLGVQVTVIKRLARWGSDVVLDYIKDTPLTRLSSEYMHALTNVSAGSSSSMMARSECPEAQPVVDLPQLQGWVADAVASLQKKSNDDQALSTRIAELERSRATPEFVLNNRTRACHRILVGSVETTPDAWHQRIDALPACLSWKSICEKCLPDERSRARIRDYWPDETGTF